MKRRNFIIVVVLVSLSVTLYMIISERDTTLTDNEDDNSTPKQTEDKVPYSSNDIVKSIEDKIDPEKPEGDYYVNDNIYVWDEKQLEWVEKDSIKTPRKESKSQLKKAVNADGPITIDWFILSDIQYKLKFFESFDLEVFAPVFDDTLESLNGKEVVIQGFVIPLFEDKDPLALSANPYASCFFCGQAGPASVLSMYMKNSSKSYKTDDYKTFKGTLYLNYDDPEEFYYLLKNAVEVR